MSLMSELASPFGSASVNITVKSRPLETVRRFLRNLLIRN
jgi:hypothetical protein